MFVIVSPPTGTTSTGGPVPSTGTAFGISRYEREFGPSIHSSVEGAGDGSFYRSVYSAGRRVGHGGRLRRPASASDDRLGLGLGRGLGLLLRRRLVLRRQLAALGDDERLHVDADVLEDLDRHVVAADPLDRLLEARSCAGRRAPCARARSRRRCRVGVTEPNRAPVGPALTSNRSTVLPSSSAICLRLVGAFAPRGGRAARRAGGSPPPWPASRARRAARQQEVARVAVGDAHDVAAQAELLDVGEQDDVHRPSPTTYGRSAISRARLIATATWRWCRRHAPVTRRLRILPFSEM